MRVPFGVWVVGGVLTGALGAGLVLGTGALDDPGRTGDDATPAAGAALTEQQAADAAAFVAAFRRSRLGTFVVDSTFERTRPDGGDGEVAREVRVAQDPPDRLQRGVRGVTARQGPTITRCSVEARRYRCESERADRSYRGLVDDEVAALEGYFAGDVPLYVPTATAGGCYTLELARPLPAAPFGTSARFCFDDETGAVTEIRVERPEAVDVTEATSVSARVRPRDLRPPEDGDRVPGG
ncbi:MAG: hypothetical protein KDB35_20950 [Acidimicrobiales bacterium]|nr:hypothetical protein [Acidimicrobiales bacterium]